MRLTKLEINGFKAFADETELLFDQGVTAIVGPNGSGKSNVSDAVRWVLGEQRARLMRGAKMEDVIFHGSSARRAVNMAEVSLHFDNEEGDLPIAFKEVVITRRLLRSGESEYMLNRTPCRLRDIQDLVRGTGLGADSGVVIEARMIDSLLSDRPVERRELFEEAAGVGLYRDRRRSAERRLEETTVDLSRLDDLIAEVQSQVRSLARQRRRAENYREITTRRYDVELSLATREMASWRDELATLDERLDAIRTEVPVAEGIITTAEAARDNAHSQRTVAEAARIEHAKLTDAQRDRTRLLERELAVSEERQRSTTERRVRAEEERRENEAFGRRLRDDREKAETDRTTLEVELRDAGEALEERMMAEADARERVVACKGQLTALETELREHSDRARRLGMDRDSAHREQAETTQKREALEVEHERLIDELATIERELEQAAERYAVARQSAVDAMQAREAARTSATVARTADAEARSALAAAVEQHVAIEGQVNALDALERERVGLAPSAQLLLRERERFGEGAVLGPLTDFVSADSDAARMVERYLGQTMHAIVVRDRTVADAIRRWHSEVEPGPLLLLPADAAGGDSMDAEALAAAVKASGAASGWVRALLGRVHAVDNGNAFVDEHGAVYLPGSASGPGPLQRRAELARLREQLVRADRDRESAQQAAEAARLALGEAERVQQVAIEHSNQQAQEERQASEVRAEAGRRKERADREINASSTLAERLVARLAELEERQQRLTQEITDSEAHASELVAGVDEARKVLAEAERELEHAREARAAWQVAQAQAQARLSVARDREQRLQEEDSAATSRLDALTQELSTLESADKELIIRLEKWRGELDAERRSLEDAESRLSVAENGVAAATAALDASELALAESRRNAAALAEQLHTAELRFTELSGKRESIRGRLETEWRRSLEDLLDGFTELDADTDELRREAAELRNKLDALGPVNQLAIEEHEEEQRRLEFLTGQRNDLTAAKHSLHQAIREIDSTARELFLATFTQARENFRHIFLTLFGGGECDLRLENPDAPLDCDIEIHASPRGKKTQRIHLLSSGERALVALSLLFGIFLTKPSPFCLLDEVDAPLDDQNIGRFVKMLNQFKSKTQFIVITHNPRTTTEAADAVYGVTMAEPGVSSIVSVRLRGPALDHVATR